jgi:ADP-heptose:LPS heptosyltransferase
LVFELHLKTYYEFAGVANGEIKRPSLYLNFDIKEHKIFKKYVVIHNDTRAQPYRNINHFSFDGIATQFRLMGYTVLQVGINGSPIQGADFIKTSNLPFLMTVVAGAELFIGIDSGISHIAQAFGVPSVIFSGSVDLRLIHPDMSKIEWVNWFMKNWKICSKPLCWHETIGCEGMECVEDKNSPPCSRFKSYYLDAEIILSNFGINKND